MTSLSVALCTYNGARFLPAQLESLAAQSRLPDELVIRDDGSSDQTLAILGEFAARAPFATRSSAGPTAIRRHKVLADATWICRRAGGFVVDVPCPA